ncbi:hypothetical protein [Acinetobacter bereziniae]|uniref:hypothetical protein n=1 Tax=Acinetobacter bereziniae TaxID=106648 RepID=UPI00300AACC7
MKPNLPQHPCANKCTEFKDEQCKTCLVQQIEDREFQLGVAPDEAYVKTLNQEYLPGDVVVLTPAGTKDELLEIINHKYMKDLYRVKVLSSGACGPVFKNDIRPATTAEIQANRRLTEAEQAIAEVS